MDLQLHGLGGGLQVTMEHCGTGCILHTSHKEWNVMSMRQYSKVSENAAYE